MQLSSLNFRAVIYFLFGCFFTAGFIWHIAASLMIGDWVFGLHWNQAEIEHGINAMYKIIGVGVLALVAFSIFAFNICKYKCTFAKQTLE